MRTPLKDLPLGYGIQCNEITETLGCQLPRARSKAAPNSYCLSCKDGEVFLGLGLPSGPYRKRSAALIGPPQAQEFEDLIPHALYEGRLPVSALPPEALPSSSKEAHAMQVPS